MYQHYYQAQIFSFKSQLKGTEVNILNTKLKVTHDTFTQSQTGINLEAKA